MQVQGCRGRRASSGVARGGGGAGFQSEGGVGVGCRFADQLMVPHAAGRQARRCLTSTSSTPTGVSTPGIGYGSAAAPSSSVLTCLRPGGLPGCPGMRYLGGEPSCVHRTCHAAQVTPMPPSALQCQLRMLFTPARAPSCAPLRSQFFRVYSPISFGKQYDKEGAFIRRFLPVLRRFPAKYIYEPWTAPLSVQQACGPRGRWCCWLLPPPPLVLLVVLCCQRSMRAVLPGWHGWVMWQPPQGPLCGGLAGGC